MHGPQRCIKREERVKTGVNVRQEEGVHNSEAVLLIYVALLQTALTPMSCMFILTDNLFFQDRI